jgi:hypothetical protein
MRMIPTLFWALVFGLMSGAPAGALNLLFESGFEPNTVLGQNTPNNYPISQPLSGVDQTTGFTWPGNVWGGAIGLSVTGGATANNQIQSVTGHNGSATNALYMDLVSIAQDSNQNSLFLTPLNTISQQGDLYTSAWFKLQPDLATNQLFPGQNPDGSWGDWRTLWEWKSGDNSGGVRGSTAKSDFRITILMNLSNNGQLFWSTTWDNDGETDPYVLYWSATNTSVPVPVGQWFQFETFTHRAADDTGHFWAKVNGVTLFDHYGPNIGKYNSPINRIWLANDYTNGHLPAYQWVDDIQIWDSPPTAQTTVVSSMSSIAAGAPFTVVFSNAPSSVKDWVGLYPAGTAYDYPLGSLWEYLNDSQTLPAAPVISGSLHFQAPSTPGQYELRLYNGETLELAASQSVTVRRR